MTKEEFDNLKVGDVVGNYQGKWILEITSISDTEIDFILTDMHSGGNSRADSCTRVYWCWCDGKMLTQLDKELYF